MHHLPHAARPTANSLRQHVRFEPAEGLQVGALLEGRQLALTVEEAPAGTTIVLLASPGKDGEFGSAALPVHGGKIVSVAR